MAVITISRELGSGGDQIADILCQELGYVRVDKDMLSHIAEEAGVDVEAVLAKERDITRKPKLISTDMTSLYSKDPSAFRQKAAMDDQTFNRIVHETMEKYAQEGKAIVVGRGGQMILQDWPGALHVHLYASEEVRAGRLAERLGISEATAKGRVARSDEQKRQYIRLMHRNANWKNLKYYHLAISTDHIPPEVAAQIIILAARHKADTLRSQ
jgi:cytidylate kinase